MNPLTRHPNAIIGGLGGGGGLGYAVLQILSEYNVHLSSKQSGLLTAGCAIGVLLLAGPAKYVWNNGVASVWHRLLHGKPGATTAAREPSAGAPGGSIVHADLADQLVGVHSKLDQLLVATAPPVDPQPLVPEASS